MYVISMLSSIITSGVVTGIVVAKFSVLSAREMLGVVVLELLLLEGASDTIWRLAEEVNCIEAVDCIEQVDNTEEVDATDSSDCVRCLFHDGEDSDLKNEIFC